jgi:hypothetical protein
MQAVRTASMAAAIDAGLRRQRKVRRYAH